MNQIDFSAADTSSVGDGNLRIAVTRTAPPGIRKFAIERQRLVTLLDKAAACRVIVLKAPAGYGKTTLAAEWCEHLEHSGAVVAWLSLDTDDNVPGTFACHVAAAVERSAPGLAQAACSLLQQSSLINPRVVLSSLVNAASEVDNDIFLVLDDFHLITDGRSLELMTFLLRYASSNLHLVIVSRADLRLPLSKLRLEGDIAEIDAAEIRFTLEEVKLLLGGPLTRSLRREGVAKLYAATEGWPAAVQLARIVLRNSDNPAAHVHQFSGTSRNIATYLEDTLAAEPPEIVDFLLQTSILDQFNGELCQAVTRLPESGALLASLEREQLLLFPLDEASGWYRYHRLMSEFLKDRLKVRMGGDVAKLHRRAYAWFASRQMWSQAVRHAIAAKDLDQAVQFIEHCAMSLVMRGDLLTLLGWEQQLPAQLMSGQLHTKVALAWGMALVTRFAEADALLTQVEGVARADPGCDLAWKCKVARAVLTSLRDDSERGRRMALDCLESAPQTPFNESNLQNVVRFGSLKAGDWAKFEAIPVPVPSGDQEETHALSESYRLCLQGMAAAQRLRFEEALGHYADAKRVAERNAGPRTVTSACVTCLIAEIVFEQGDICGAEIAVMDDLDLIETAAFHEAFLKAYLVLVRAARSRGEVQSALSLLNRGERLAWERGWPRVVAAMVLERIRIHIGAGRLEEARSMLQSLEDLKASHPAPVRCSWSEIHAFSMIAHGLFADAAGQSETGAGLLCRAYQDLLTTGNLLGSLRVGAEAAIALGKAGRTEDAFTLLAEVLTRAAGASASSLVLDWPKQVHALIAAWAESDVAAAHGEARSFATELLLRPQPLQAGDHVNGAKPGKQGLTDREKKIVAFIAGGQSNKEIARALGVAPETVKTHIKRIFIKLSAETRAQAVVRAHSMGLLKGAGADVILTPG